MSTTRELAKMIDCTRCGARVGEGCRTRAGGSAYWPHSARTNTTNAIWLEGFKEGSADWCRDIARVAESGTGRARLVDSAQRELRWIDEPS